MGNILKVCVNEEVSLLAKTQKAGVPIHDEQWLLDLLKEHGTNEL